MNQAYIGVEIAIMIKFRVKGLYWLNHEEISYWTEKYLRS